jgi:hypothetical protein
VHRVQMQVQVQVQVQVHVHLRETCRPPVQVQVPPVHRVQVQVQVQLHLQARVQVAVHMPRPVHHFAERAIGTPTLSRRQLCLKCSRNTNSH